MEHPCYECLLVIAVVSLKRRAGVPIVRLHIAGIVAANEVVLHGANSGCSVWGYDFVSSSSVPVNRGIAIRIRAELCYLFRL